MSRRLILISCFLGFIITTFSQEAIQEKTSSTKKEVRKARDKYLALGMGFSKVKVMDQATSPLLYGGMEIASAKLDYLVHSEKVIKTLEAEFGFGWLKSGTISPWYNPTITSYRFNLRYNQLYSIQKFARGKINWYLGPEANMNGHFRVNYKYDNSALNFEAYTGLGIATRFEFPMHYDAKQLKLWFIKINRRDRDLRLNWQFSTPIVGYIIRPTYVTVTNFIDPDLQTSINPGQTAFGLFIPVNLRSQTELYYMLHNQNMLKLSYIWNFYSYDAGFNKVQSASHGFLLSFVFKFNYKSPTE